MVWSSGCSAPPGTAEPTLTRVSAGTPEAYEQLWGAVGDTLRRQFFRLDRQDRLAGVITTFPETTAHFAEIWRPQSDDPAIWAEDNLHTIQRQARITLAPAGEIGAYEISVQVDRLRYTLEERQIDNSAGALRMFGAEAPTVSGRTERPSRTASWIPVGRDKPMEEQLLTAILRRYDRAAPPATQPAQADNDSTAVAWK